MAGNSHLAFDSMKRVIDVQGVNVEGEMAMFPVAPVQQAQADQLVGEKPATTGSDPVCEWLDAPRLIGTNAHIVWEEDEYLVAEPEFLDQSCEHTERGITEKADDKEFLEVLRKYYELHCIQLANKKELAGGGDLEMEMTLILRFTSPSFGAGTLYFDGRTTRSRFKASAPVTISR
jgi:hypothetical protein